MKSAALTLFLCVGLTVPAFGDWWETPAPLMWAADKNSLRGMDAVYWFARRTGVLGDEIVDERVPVGVYHILYQRAKRTPLPYPTDPLSQGAVP